MSKKLLPFTFISCFVCLTVNVTAQFNKIIESRPQTSPTIIHLVGKRSVLLGGEPFPPIPISIKPTTPKTHTARVRIINTFEYFAWCDTTNNERWSKAIYIRPKDTTILYLSSGFYHIKCRSVPSVNFKNPLDWEFDLTISPNDALQQKKYSYQMLEPEKEDYNN